MQSREGGLLFDKGSIVQAALEREPTLTISGKELSAGNEAHQISGTALRLYQLMIQTCSLRVILRFP